MAKYYNTTRGPIACSLLSGASVAARPKSWFTIAPADEGSPGLLSMVRKGYLVRSKISDSIEEVSESKTSESSAVLLLPTSDFTVELSTPSKAEGSKTETKKKS
jgi:hypothetical protein